MLDFSIETILSNSRVSADDDAPYGSRERKEVDEIANFDNIRKEYGGFVPRLIVDSCSDVHPLLRFVDVRLLQQSLWLQFHRLATEMIVTKSGRRMFPVLQCSILGLNPVVEYSVLIDFKMADHSSRYRYSFHQSTWMQCGPADQESPPRRHVHPDSPALGRYWTRQPVSFDKLKLTNNQLDQNGHIILNSMHKYIPQIYVILSATTDSFFPCTKQFSKERMFLFPETEFIAVTAYQNHEITRLKIATNPFAKGFRDHDSEDLSSQLFLS